MTYQVECKAKVRGRWIREKILVKADSREEAIRKADRWPPLILSVKPLN